jgi:endonuclease/exonuclease/phosphatase (EEP) superfamily protein YafD
LTETLEEATVPSPPLAKGAKLAGLLWAGTALLTVFTYWQEPHLLTLISAFRVQLLITLCVLSVPPMILFRDKRRWLFPAVPAVIAATFLSYFIPPVPATGPTLKVAVANVYSGNQDISELASWVDKNDIQILGVLETAPHHVEALQELGFETMVLEPRNSNFGIAFLSKVVPISSTVLESDTPFPSILAEYEHYQVLLTHPVPPMSGQAREMGDEQVVRLAKVVESSPKPTIVMGDFNATAWDLRMLPFRELGFKDARKGFGILPTWPTDNKLMWIPIDHIFLPQDWSATDCAVGPDIGSDHFPMRATLVRPGP